MCALIGHKTILHEHICKHGFHSSFIASLASRHGFLRLSCVLPTSRVFTSGYVNTETILHFFTLRSVSNSEAIGCLQKSTEGKILLLLLTSVTLNSLPKL